MRIVKENSNISPKSIYGKTKLLGEKLIKTNLKKSKINYAILRYFNVAGASKSGKIGQISKGDQLFKNLSVASLRNKPKIYIYGKKLFNQRWNLYKRLYSCFRYSKNSYFSFEKN